jgi:signal transduction histidine kinase
VSWALVAVLCVVVVRLRRRLELVAHAEHELRGPLTAFMLGLDAARRGRPVDLEAEIARAQMALADLSAARRGRRAAALPSDLDLERLVRSSASVWGAPVDWGANGVPIRADGGRIAQAVGNLLANAVEHGVGEAAVFAERDERGVRVHVTNALRGQGLKIAAAAATDAGGSLSVERGDGEFRATLELPAAS